MNNPIHPVGDLLRQWRLRRRLSQLALACDADISTRHLSFLETGRSLPSREMLLNLSERLDVPLRDRNVLLRAAGFAPMFQERALDDPALDAARGAVAMVLTGHEPVPALAVDRYWNLSSANRMIAPLLEGVEPALLTPPVNVLRLSLHPGGLAGRTVNFAEWRAHLLGRLRRQVDSTADPDLDELLKELSSIPTPIGAAREGRADGHDLGGVVVPFILNTPAGVLSFMSTTTVFGTPVDVTLSELAIESFFPADPATSKSLAEMFEKLTRSTAPRLEPGTTGIGTRSKAA